MSNRSLFSIALFFSLSLPVLAETPPVTTPVKTEQAPEVKAPEAPNGNTATPATPSETTEAPAENTATTGAEGTEAEGTTTATPISLIIVIRTCIKSGQR